MRINSVKLNNSFIRTKTANFVANKQEQKKNFKSSLECFAVYNQISFKSIETGEVLEFESKMKAAEFFGITRQRLDSVLKTKTEYKGYYIID